MRQVAMLRGINLGPNRRVPMADLRQALADAGFANVETYVQSGNIALDSTAKPPALQRTLAELIEQRFGFEVPVIVRSARQLAAVVEHDPFGESADNPKRYQVSFLDAKLPAATAKRLDELARNSERVVVRGREVYAWHPDGVARSKLWNALAGKDLGVTATARNWTTVLKLLEMAGG
jgi:uncharacterized protein (DUF1697 family)